MRTDVPATVEPAVQNYTAVPGNSFSVLNHQQGLLSFSRYLDAWMNHQGQDAIEAYQRIQKEYSGLDAKIDVAEQRFRMFLSGSAQRKKGIKID